MGGGAGIISPAALGATTAAGRAATRGGPDWSVTQRSKSSGVCTNTMKRMFACDVPQNSEHYKAFLEKFVAQDKQIEGHQKNLRDLNATMQTQIRDYDAWLSKLDAE